MNEQMKGEAMEALVDAFYEDYSSLVNVYVRAAKGLDEQLLEMRLQELSSVFGRDDDITGDAELSIYSLDGEGRSPSHRTVLEAMSEPDAIEVHVGCTKLVKTDGEWEIVE